MVEVVGCYLAFLFLLMVFAKYASSLPGSQVLCTSFPGRRALRSGMVRLSSICVHCPFQMRISNSRTIILSLRNASICYRLFRCPSFRCLSSFNEEKSSPRRVLSMRAIGYVSNSF